MQPINKILLIISLVLNLNCHENAKSQNLPYLNHHTAKAIKNNERSWTLSFSLYNQNPNGEAAHPEFAHRWGLPNNQDIGFDVAIAPASLYFDVWMYLVNFDYRKQLNINSERSLFSIGLAIGLMSEEIGTNPILGFNFPIDYTFLLTDEVSLNLSPKYISFTSNNGYSNLGSDTFYGKNIGATFGVKYDYRKGNKYKSAIFLEFTYLKLISEKREIWWPGTSNFKGVRFGINKLISKSWMN